MTAQAGTAFGWKTLTIFISSTFRDMDAERDVLRDIVFPELAERLRDRRCELVGIDLRWGVDTMRFEHQADKEMEVLSVCLREIERSRPFFFVLLGDRYGWVPPSDRIVDAARATGVDVDPTGWSVTKLEVEHGVLSDPDTAAGSVAMLRNSLPYAEMRPEVAARYSDRHAPDSGAGQRAADLDSLKQQVLDRLGTRVAAYDVEWDGDQVTGLEEFRRRATELLWEVLDAATSERLGAVPSTWIDRENLAIEMHCRDRARDVFGRDDVIGSLTELCTSEDSDVRAAVVVGDSGIGKSAVLARLALELRTARCRVLQHVAGVSSDSTSSRAVLLRWCDELQQGTSGDDGAGPPDEMTPMLELAERFQLLLAEAAREQRVVLLVDAIDQFADGPRGRRLSWLPELPTDVRVVVSVTPGDDADAVSDRQGWHRVSLEALDRATAERVVDSLSQRRSRSMPAAVRKQLVGGGARSPLWLRGAIHDLLELGAEEYRLLDTLDGSAEAGLERLLVEHVASLPEDATDLYAAIFARAAPLHGVEFVHNVLGLLALSRDGLREPDLASLTGLHWKPLRFARLRQQLAPHLVQRENGRWDFTHRQARAAASHLLDEQAQIELHHAIAEQLGELPPDDPVAGTELIYHRIAAGDRRDLIHLLAEPSSETLESSIAPTLATHLVGLTTADPAHARLWISGLLTTTDVDSVDRRCAAGRIAGTVINELDGRAEPASRAALLEEIIGLLQQPDLFDTDSEVVSLLIHASLHRGHALGELGDFAGARSTLEHTLAIAERADETTSIFVDVDCNSCGAVLARDERFTNVAPAMSTHLRACGLEGSARVVESLAEFGGDTDRGRDIAHVRAELGSICELQGDFGQARTHLTEAARVHQGIVEIYLNQMMGIEPREGREIGATKVELQSDPEVLWAVQCACDSLCRLGKLEDECGDHASAMHHLASASALAASAVEQLGEQHEIAMSRTFVELSTAEVAARQGRPAFALQTLQALTPLLVRAHRSRPTDAQLLRSLLRCYQDLVLVAFEAGDAASVRDAAPEMEALARSVRRQGLDSLEVAELEWNTEVALAGADEARGDHAAAHHRYRRALEALRRHVPSELHVYGYGSRQLDLLGLMVGAARRTGLQGEAEESCREIIEICRELQRRQPGDVRPKRHLGLAHTVLGSIALWAGELETAAEHLTVAERCLREIGPAGDALLADTRAEIGVLHAMLGDAHRAKASLGEAERFLIAARRAGDRGADVLRALGGVQDRLGSVEEQLLDAPATAVKHYEHSLDARLEYHQRMDTEVSGWHVIHSYERLADVTGKLGDADRRRGYLESAVDVVTERSATDSSWQYRSIGVRVSLSLGEARALDGEFERAIALFQLALEQVDLTDRADAPDAELRWARAKGLDGLGQCARLLGRRDEARACLRGAVREDRALMADPANAEGAAMAMLGGLELLAFLADEGELRDLYEEANTVLRLVDENRWTLTENASRIAEDLRAGAEPWGGRLGAAEAT